MSFDKEGSPKISATNVEARTTSSVVTPKTLFQVYEDAPQYNEYFSAYRFGSKTPCFLRTSATIGTVELTGLEMTRTKAFGAAFAIPVARSFTIPALI